MRTSELGDILARYIDSTAIVLNAPSLKGELVVSFVDIMVSAPKLRVTIARNNCIENANGYDVDPATMLTLTDFEVSNSIFAIGQGGDMLKFALLHEPFTCCDGLIDGELYDDDRKLVASLNKIIRDNKFYRVGLSRRIFPS